MNVSLRRVRGSYAHTVIVFFGFVKTVHEIFGAGFCKSALSSDQDENQHPLVPRSFTFSLSLHVQVGLRSFGVGSFYGVIVRATVIAREDRHNVSKFVEFAHTPKGGNIH